MSGRFSRMPAAAVFDRRLKPEAKMVLAAFATYADRDGLCWPSLATIGNRLGMKDRMVQRWVKVLKETGYLIKLPAVQTDGGRRLKPHKVLYPDPDEVLNTSPHDAFNDCEGNEKASPDDALPPTKASPDDALPVTPCRKKASPDDVSLYMNSPLNYPNKNSPLVTAHFTTRQAVSSDDAVDQIIDDDFGSVDDAA